MYPIINQEVAKKTGWLQDMFVFVVVRMYKSLYGMIWLLIVVGIKFSWVSLDFLSMMIIKFYIHGV